MKLVENEGETGRCFGTNLEVMFCGGFMKVTKLLAFRLFLIILVVMFVGTGIFTTLSVNLQSRQILHTMVSNVSQMSDLIKRSLHYSMLLNRREDIYQIITTIGSEPGIEAIRIYNKKGEITFSTVGGEVGKSVNMSAEACNVCHVAGKAPLSPNPSELTRIFRSPKGYRVLGMITPIRNELKCSSADCHAHPASQTVLGVLDVMVPLGGLDENLASLRQERYTSALLMVIVVAGLAGVFIWLMVNIPVRKLTLGTQEIMKGNLDYRISVRTNDEIGQLAESFNRMGEELKRARDELTQWAQTLEQRVDEKTEQLRRAQVNIIQMEKMASLGKLAATVAHELNNPLEGVLTYARLLKKKIRPGELSPEQVSEIVEVLSIISDETARCGSIVKNLLLFSRQRVGEFSEEDLRAIVERSVKLIEHHLKMHNIKLELDLGNQPAVLLCDPYQIEQALLALEINAVEAMPEGGVLSISINSVPELEAVRLKISDTGIGIREEDIPHIFEPFFTTKKEGKGTGLGLSIVYGIIERHGGSIAVQSRLHEGTTFTITLPCNSRPTEGIDSTSKGKNVD